MILVAPKTCKHSILASQGKPTLPEHSYCMQSSSPVKASPTRPVKSFSTLSLPLSLFLMYGDTEQRERELFLFLFFFFFPFLTTPSLSIGVQGERWKDVVRYYYQFKPPVIKRKVWEELLYRSLRDLLLCFLSLSFFLLILCFFVLSMQWETT